MNALQRFFKPSNLNLIRELVSSDFKLRYQGSVLGYLWSLLRPLMMFGVLYLVFTKVVRVGNNVPHYPAYLLLGLVLWQFFVEATVGGMNAITGRGDLVRKVNIPKYIIVISTNISAFINFCLNLVVVVIFMLIGHVGFHESLVLVPFLVGELIALCLGISFLLSAFFVKFRDLGHIWDVVLQIMFYATPLIYSLSIVPHKYAKIIAISPLTQIVQDIRSVTITPQALTTKQVYHSQLLGRGWPVLFIVTLCIVGGWYFRSRSKTFAEEL